MSDIGTIHADPTAPVRVNSNSLALTGEAVLADIEPFVATDAPFVLEVRHLGAALAQQPTVPTAVGHRSAWLNLFTSAYPTAEPTDATQAQQRVCESFASASTGGPLRTFLPTSYPDATACYEADTATKLADLKTAWDPSNLFRYAPAVTAQQDNSKGTS